MIREGSEGVEKEISPQEVGTLQLWPGAPAPGQRTHPQVHHGDELSDTDVRQNRPYPFPQS